MKLLYFATIFSGLVAAVPGSDTQIPIKSKVIRPAVRSQYAVWTGAITYNTGVGKIFKDGRSSDITTLITFNIPNAVVGKKVAFHFYTDAATSAAATGSRQFDLYTSSAPAKKSTTTWPPGNQREKQIGRYQLAKSSGEAALLAEFPQEAASYTFNSAGAYGIELVGVNDNDYIAW
jgi:hypothetical protein